MKIKKLTAAVLALVLVLVCTSCATIEVHVPADMVPLFNQNGQANQNGQNNGGNDAGNSGNPVVPDTQAPTNGGSDTTEAPTANGGETPTDGGSSTGAPTDKAAIVKMYQDSYNKIEKEAKAVVRTYDYTNNYNKILKIGDNKQITALAEKLMNQFMVENKKEEKLSAKELPPIGYPNMNLNPSNYSSATCVDKGTYYEVTLKSTGTDSNYEVDSPAGTGSAGSICPILDPNDVTNAAGSFIKFEGLHTKYATASATVKIDKATGRPLEFAFLTPSVLHFDKVTALGFIKIENCDIGLLFHQNWRIEY